MALVFCAFQILAQLLMFSLLFSQFLKNNICLTSITHNVVCGALIGLDILFVPISVACYKHYNSPTHNLFEFGAKWFVITFHLLVWICHIINTYVLCQTRSVCYQ